MALTFDKSRLFRNPAGVRRGDWDSHLERVSLHARTYRDHWNARPPFQVSCEPRQAYKRDPYYTGTWNPVMWSDYPKQPAWSVPMPKMAVDIRSHQVHQESCFIAPTEHMKKISFPTWFPDLPDRNMPHCNPYFCYQSLHYANTWRCP